MVVLELLERRSRGRSSHVALECSVVGDPTILDCRRFLDRAGAPKKGSTPKRWPNSNPLDDLKPQREILIKGSRVLPKINPFVASAIKPSGGELRSPPSVDCTPDADSHQGHGPTRDTGQACRVTRDEHTRRTQELSSSLSLHVLWCSLMPQRPSGDSACIPTVRAVSVATAYL